ncbi:unnamed protein product [Pseudo-nitzschia multistriata]|uniref:CRAL-TRIO domain-containing protein n=1 Tax=Pseudo-nitzschia multistriata TaxID=183589 RepID=A0A448ZRU0_9STRA|nr:unnamed protein product [Pseudo-nitzschia multistriata]
MSSIGGTSRKTFRLLSFALVVTLVFLFLEGEASSAVDSKRNNDGINVPRFEVYDLPAIQWACEPFLEAHERFHLNPMKEKTRDLCLKLRGGKLGDAANDVVVLEESTEGAAENTNRSMDVSSITVLEDEENEVEVDDVEEDLSSPSSPTTGELPMNGSRPKPTTIENEHLDSADDEHPVPSQESISEPSASPTDYTFSVFQKGDGHETDPDGIPTRYLNMQGGRRDLAKTALMNTVKWREENDVDTILARPHPKYDVSKAVFPHYFCGRDDTQHVILLQRPGLMNVKLAHKNGLTGEELLFHYIYVMEYLWRIIDPEPDATMTSIIDLTELNMSILRKREQLRIGSLFLSTMDAHFPQRSHRTFLINAPRWFGALYKIASPLLRESTKEKIMILSQGKEQDAVLRDLLRDCPIPDGEKLENVPAGIMEEELRNFCMARLEEAGAEMQVVEEV